MTPQQRPYNFSAGPSAMPEAVLRQAAAEMLDWQGSGMGVMEMSHRGPAFMSILSQAEADLRALLAIPAHFKILFMQGGGLAENAIIPLNLCRGTAVDVVVSGAWSAKSLKEASKYADARAAASNEADGHTSLPAPASWQLRAQAAYVHLCSNETIHGVECHSLPDLAALGCTSPLVVDASSHILSRSIDWARVGLVFAGAQKNIGPAGLTLVVVRQDLLGHALDICPSAFNYQLVAENGSMYNTPPTYAIYIAGLTFAWIKNQSEGSQHGVAAMEARSIAKSQALYQYIDQSSLYTNLVASDCRSRMNVPFFLQDDGGTLLVDANHPRNRAFLAGAEAAGLLQLKGHKSLGGMRASLYNAIPLAAVHALVDYMREFERKA